MEQLQTVLVVLLSIGFGILLLLGIVATIIVIRIISNIRHITQRIDETSENMGELVKYAGKKIAPAALSAMGSVMWRKATSKVKKGK